MIAARKSDQNVVVKQSHIADAVNSLTQQRLDEFGAWQDLADLSSRTEFEGVDVNPDSIVLTDDGGFEASADIYVLLNYGSKGDMDSFSDAYVATIRGAFAGMGVTISSIQIDTRAFYQ